MKIAIINTGGTISCTGNPLAPMTASQFAAASQSILNPIIEQQYPKLTLEYLTDLQFPESSSHTLDSTNLQPTDWCLLATYILQHYEQYDALLVLHGTDSMAFTGAALPFLLTRFSKHGIATAVLSKPIIITGSQVPMFYQNADDSLSLNNNTDAFQNFCGAIAAAQTGIPEVCIYFNYQLFRANRVLKTNASQFNAFSSPNYPILANGGITFSIINSNVLPPPVNEQVSLDCQATRNDVLAQLAYIQAHINLFPVMQFNAFPAFYNYQGGAETGLIAQLLNACLATGIKGLILESYGEGNFPSGCPNSVESGSIYLALQNAQAQNIIVVDCTQVISGTVNNNAYAAGAWLPKVGALNPADMTAVAALAKLMILLSSAGYAKNNWSLPTIKQLFQQNLLGEMLSVNRLDSRTNNELLPTQKLTTLDGSAALVNDPELGIVLYDLTDTEPKELWTALKHPKTSDMPARLIMQNDGNLVLYSRGNSPLWASNTGNPNGASSILSLDGSCNSQLSLQLYNYSTNTVSKVLWKSHFA